MVGRWASVSPRLAWSGWRDIRTCSHSLARGSLWTPSVSSPFRHGKLPFPDPFPGSSPFWLYMVRVAGLEPATSGPPALRATNYATPCLDKNCEYGIMNCGRGKLLAEMAKILYSKFLIQKNGSALCKLVFIKPSGWSHETTTVASNIGLP